MSQVVVCGPAHVHSYINCKQLVQLKTDGPNERDSGPSGTRGLSRGGRRRTPTEKEKLRYIERYIMTSVSRDLPRSSYTGITKDTRRSRHSTSHNSYTCARTQAKHTCKRTPTDSDGRTSSFFLPSSKELHHVQLSPFHRSSPASHSLRFSRLWLCCHASGLVLSRGGRYLVKPRGSLSGIDCPGPPSLPGGGGRECILSTRRRELPTCLR